MASVRLSAIIEKMKLDNLTPEINADKIRITQPDINRPALQLAGFFEHYEATRLQVIGFVEYKYMMGLTDESGMPSGNGHDGRNTENGSERIVVCGLGTIGLLLTMFLRERGFKNIYVVGNKDRQKETAVSLGIPEENFCDLASNCLATS